MEKDVVDILMKLPPVVFTRNKATGETIGIRRGVMGYYKLETARTPEELNGPEVTPLHVHCMENGSMFGWEVSGSDPDWLIAKGFFTPEGQPTGRVA